MPGLADRPRVRTDQLAAELEGEEGIARRRLLHSSELRAGQVEPQPLLEQPWTAPRLSGPIVSVLEMAL